MHTCTDPSKSIWHNTGIYKAFTVSFAQAFMHRLFNHQINFARAWIDQPFTVNFAHALMDKPFLIYFAHTWIEQFFQANFTHAWTILLSQFYPCMNGQNLQSQFCPCMNRKTFKASFAHANPSKPVNIVLLMTVVWFRPSLVLTWRQVLGFRLTHWWIHKCSTFQKNLMHFLFCFSGWRKYFKTKK